MINSTYHHHRSGLWLPYKKRPTAIDLFCGCGGFSLGIMQAGFEVVAAVENDPYATMTYALNLGSYPINFHFVEESDKERLNKAIMRQTKMDKKGDIVKMPVSGQGWISHNPDISPVKNFWFGDIRKISGKDILDTLGMELGEVDLVCGGPPCQGFSTSGKRDIMDPRNSLIFEFARLVHEIKPKTMIMENVPGILNMVTPEGVPVVDAFCRVLEDGGFGTFNALKKSLLMSSGAGAALRGKPKEKKAQKAEVEKQDVKVTDQVSLFG